MTRISGPDGPLILAVDLRNTPKGGGYGRTHRENIFEKFENIFEKFENIFEKFENIF